MKKLFLSLMSAAFACSAFAGAVVPEGEYLIVNVETGYYLAGGLDWGTHACLVSKPQFFNLALVAETEDTYTFDSHQSNGGDSHFLGSALYVDAAAANWVISTNSDGTITISDGDKYLSGNGTNAVVQLKDDEDASSVWKLVSMEDVVASQANATAIAPVDVTAFIKDPQLKRNGNTSGYWTITSFDGTAKPSNFAQGQDGNVASCAESYHSGNGFKAVQPIGNLKKGVYALSCSAFYRQDGSDTENMPYLFAGEEKSFFPQLTGSENNMVSAYASFLAGNYVVSPIYFSVEDGANVEIGLACANTTMWNIFGELTLKYFGEGSVADIKAAAILTDYNAVTGKVMEEAVSTAMETAKSTYDANPTDENLATFSKAVADAKASVAAYEGAQEKLAGMKALVDATNVYTAAALEEYYGQWAAKYEARTLTTSEANALQNPAAITNWHANNTVDDLLVSVWDVEPMVWDNYHVNTWSTEGESDGSEFKVPFIEYWTGDANSLGEKTLTATMTGLKPGQYQVKAWVRVRAKNDVAAADATGITLVANDGTPVDVTEGQQVGESQFNLGAYKAIGTVGEDGILKIQFVVAADNNISWLSFKNVSYGGDATALEEAIAEAKTITLKDATNKATLNAAIEAAEAVANGFASIDEIEAALTTLKEAVALAKKQAIVESYVFGKYAYYSWEAPEGVECTKGGTLTTGASNTVRVNYHNSGYYTICLNGKSSDLSDNFILLTLDEGLAFKAGDVINMTAYYNKGVETQTSAYMQFKPSDVQITDESDWKDIDERNTADFSATPLTYSFTVPEGANGDTQLLLTRKLTGTNLFITKLEICRYPVDIEISPAEGDIAAALATATEGKVVNNITINLTAGATYTLSSSIVAPNNLTISGDAANPAIITMAEEMTGDFVTLNGTTEFAVKKDGTDSDHKLISSVYIYGVKIQGLKGAFITDAQKTLVENLTVTDVVVEMPGGDAKKNVFNFNGKGYIGALYVKNSTIYAIENNKGFFAQYGSRPKNVNEDLLQLISIENSTIVNIAYGNNFCNFNQKGTAQNLYVLTDNLFVNCGKKGQTIVGVNAGQSSASPSWSVSGNAFNYDGEDVGQAEVDKAGNNIAQNTVFGVMTFAGANDFGGNFALAEGAVAPESLGDPRWTITFGSLVGISELAAPAENNAAVYDLQGRRATGKGLLIRNGKVVLVK